MREIDLGCEIRWGKNHERAKVAPLEDPRFSAHRVDREAPLLEILPDSRIRDKERMKVSWYHAQVINSSQVTVCMAEPQLYEVFDHEAAGSNSRSTSALRHHLQTCRLFSSVEKKTEKGRGRCAKRGESRKKSD
ncbi:MAG: hypothetical protein ACYTG0_24045 [Planctomycetota bacterium]